MKFAPKQNSLQARFIWHPVFYWSNIHFIDISSLWKFSIITLVTFSHKIIFTGEKKKKSSLAEPLYLKSEGGKSQKDSRSCKARPSFISGGGAIGVSRWGPRLFELRVLQWHQEGVIAISGLWCHRNGNIRSKHASLTGCPSCLGITSLTLIETLRFSSAVSHPTSFRRLFFFFFLSFLGLTHGILKFPG